MTIIFHNKMHLGGCYHCWSKLNVPGRLECHITSPSLLKELSISEYCAFYVHCPPAVLFPEGQCDGSTMKCARCLLQLQCLRLLGQSARSAAQYGALLQSASSDMPQHQVNVHLHA